YISALLSRTHSAALRVRASALSYLFFLNDTLPSEIYTLSLHDALPIFGERARDLVRVADHREAAHALGIAGARLLEVLGRMVLRSEEHTSELQSLTNLVCRLLLEKKKTPLHIYTDISTAVPDHQLA